MKLKSLAMFVSRATGWELLLKDHKWSPCMTRNKNVKDNFIWESLVKSWGISCEIFILWQFVTLWSSCPWPRNTFPTSAFQELSKQQMQHEVPFRATETLAWFIAQIRPHADVDKATMATVMHSRCQLDRIWGKCVWNWGRIGLACMLVWCDYACAWMWFW